MKKKIVSWLLIATMTLSLVACGGSEEPAEEATQTEETTEQTEEPADSEEDNTIELIAGEQGEYGKEITMSEGTDMEESFYVYYIPAGTYTVTNEGDFMTQVNVYEGFAKNEESGYDEYTSTGDILMLDSEQSDTLEVPEGWFIEIQEPTHISLTLTDSE